MKQRFRGAVLWYKENALMLFTLPDKIHDVTLDEIKWLKSKKVIMVAINDSVLSELKGIVTNK